MYASPERKWALIVSPHLARRGWRFTHLIGRTSVLAFGYPGYVEARSDYESASVALRKPHPFFGTLPARILIDLSLPGITDDGIGEDIPNRLRATEPDALFAHTHDPRDRVNITFFKESLPWPIVLASDAKLRGIEVELYAQPDGRSKDASAVPDLRQRNLVALACAWDVLSPPRVAEQLASLTPASSYLPPGRSGLHLASSRLGWDSAVLHLFDACASMNAGKERPRLLLTNDPAHPELMTLDALEEECR